MQHLETELIGKKPEERLCPLPIHLPQRNGPVD